MTGVLIRGGDQDTDMQGKDSVKTQGGGTHPGARERGPRRNHPANTLVSDFQPPALLQNKLLLFEPQVCGTLLWQPSNLIRHPIYNVKGPPEHFVFPFHALFFLPSICYY